jgi:large subunit ribosomal protein L10
LAISKERKHEVVAEYGEWASRSQVLILTEYKGVTMKQLDELRRKVREVGGEFHIVKNTLASLAFKEQGMPTPQGFFEGSTAVGFAFTDAPAMIKAMSEFIRTNEFIKVKGGYLDKLPITADDVKALAELPPLPVIRAQLMGTLLAPASQLARILAEPARRMASVVKAYADREPAAEAA